MSTVLLTVLTTKFLLTLSKSTDQDVCNTYWNGVTFLRLQVDNLL